MLALERRILVDIFVFLLLMVSGVYLFLILGESFVSTDPPKMVDVIIVLGSSAEPDGSPSKVMQSRTRKSVELYERGYAPIVLFTGSAIGNSFLEAEVMAKYAMALGIPANSIIIETKATNTLENALYSTEIMASHNWSSAIIVTSPYHTLRAGQAFANYGVQIFTVSAVDPSDLPLHTRVRDIIHELIAFAYLKLTTGITEIQVSKHNQLDRGLLKSIDV